MAAQQAASVLHSFPFRAAVLALCVALLPLVPSQEPGAGAGAGQAFLAKAWELIHLLFVGIAVSYGLFSRKNRTDDGRAVVAATAAEKDATVGQELAKADARYAWRMFRDSIAPFDDDDGDVLAPDSPRGGGEGGGSGKVRSWSALHRHDEPVVVVTNGGGGRNGHSADGQAPLSLPVRTLKPQQTQDANVGDGAEPPRARPRRSSQDSAAGGARDETVLLSPIPWRSRSGRLDVGRPASPNPSPSPKRLPPTSSSSRDTLAKASEEEYYAKRRSPYKFSISSQPPAPPPPPPPFLVHGYHPAAERRRAAGKSFKEELQDHRMRGRGEDHYSPNTTSFSISGYSNSNSSPAKARSSFDGGSSSSSSLASVGKSVRTISSREAAVFQGQSQELPDDAGDGRDDVLGVHGSEDSYAYRAYQSIPRFQYERSVIDPILGGVAVSSDETESSDDDDDDDVGGGAYSTRESSPEVDENEVDKKAEEFIARFREQIRRQRIESIKRSAGPRGVKHGK
ncbi:uncharacterized protein LOC133907919 [Phragmites australis]|uniref:uncharacterized protein LOC133907919 n=1 Tax=Phragmites australis TaxID=29695 RepID=UPI002D78B585|nr:uncharacterized protein LOC133907919 [Phragmites australis]